MFLLLFYLLSFLFLFRCISLSDNTQYHSDRLYFIPKKEFFFGSKRLQREGERERAREIRSWWRALLSTNGPEMTYSFLFSLFGNVIRTLCFSTSVFICDSGWNTPDSLLCCCCHRLSCCGLTCVCVCVSVDYCVSQPWEHTGSVVFE